MRRLAIVLIPTVTLLAAACGDDGGETTVDDERIAEVAEDLGFTCDGPAGSAGEENRLCTDDDGAEVLRTFVWSSSDRVDTRTEFLQDQVCRAPDFSFTVVAIGENWVAESLYDVAALDPDNADEVRADAEALAERIVDELGGEVQVLDHEDC